MQRLLRAWRARGAAMLFGLSLVIPAARSVHAQAGYSGVWTEVYCKAVDLRSLQDASAAGGRIYTDGMYMALNGDSLLLADTTTSILVKEEQAAMLLRGTKPETTRIRVFGTLTRLAQADRTILEVHRVKILEQNIAPPRLWSTATCTAMSVQQLRKQGFLGQKVYLDGKYKEIVGNHIYLLDKHPDMIRLAGHSVAQRLITGIRSGKDNIRLFGKMQTHPDTGDVEFAVYWLEKTASDATRFHDRYDAIAREDFTAYYELAEWVKQQGIILDDPELEGLAVAAYRAGLAAEKDSLSADAVDARIRLAEKYIAYTGDESTAIALYKEAVAIDPGNTGVIAILEGYGLLPYRQQWIPIDLYWEREGFVRLDGRWVRPERKALELAIQRRRQAPDPLPEKTLQRHWEENVSRAIQEDRLLPGMSRKQVIQSWGYPTRVDQKSEHGTVYQQWMYQDENRIVYLEDGLVFSWTE